MKLYIKRLSFFLICVIAYSCATPSSPTGGPRDEEGPKIISSEPETGTVNFDGSEIALHFSEFVERSSFTKALTIEPEVGLDYDIDWGRKSVAIKFASDIPESTTLIITIGTDFSDLNGNSMASPFKVAVSTGPEIDKGKLIGKVFDARTGEGNEAERVLLYRSPADLSKPANYIGETDTSGVVNFSYLREGKYKAFWVDDRNRNKIWEPKRERAQPFGEEFLTLAKAGEDTLGTLFIANSDTAKPKLQGVGLFSNHRLRLRFSENVDFTDSTHIQIDDTTGNKVSNAYPLYISPPEKYIVFVHSKKVLAPERSFQLKITNIADVAGNIIAKGTQDFTGSAQKDTTKQRIIDISGKKGIFPQEPIDVVYAKPISKASLRDSLKVADGDTVQSPWKKLKIQYNKMHIFPDGSWRKGKDYNIKIWNPIIKNYSNVTPTIWHDSDLGSLHIVFTDSTADEASRSTRLVLKTKEGKQVADTTFTEEITLDGLAPISHQLKLYQDKNKNGSWDFGKVDPYQAPEPFYIRNDVPVKKGFTSDLDVTFKK